MRPGSLTRAFLADGRYGFDDKEVRVISMAIDETVEDRLKGVVAPIVARLDGIDAQLKGIDTRFTGIESQIKGVSDRLSARKYEVAAISLTAFAALLGICIAAYEYVIKPLLASP